MGNGPRQHKAHSEGFKVVGLRTKQENIRGKRKYVGLSRHLEAA